MTGIADIVRLNRGGSAVAIASWCTANEDVLRAILRAHRQQGQDPILIEATCNQVNQDGGYTGMTPQDFRLFVEGLAQAEGVAADRLILGGDHLGPNPWKARNASEAMAKACDMVRAYVAAGFTKIHLDASMACADDGVLAETTMAERAAELCAAAEAASGGAALSYVIGTEVPIPGGETEAISTLALTRPESAVRTVELHRRAFAGRGLAAAFARVVGLVVQPGVDFGNSQVVAFDPTKVQGLAGAVRSLAGLAYEAHSTDYQSEAALRGLAAHHFAILKVGPELTFAYREAILAMAALEEWLAPAQPSAIVAALRLAMDANPASWRPYILPGEPAEEARFFGLSDRIRYYWPAPGVAQAVKHLRHNIDGARPSPGLLAQYAGVVAEGGEALSDRIIQSKVGPVVARYRSAGGLS